MQATERILALLWAIVLLLITLVMLASGPAAADITGSDRVVVTNVVDGDTIDVKFSDGSTDRVRFKAVDTPESGTTQSQPREYDGADSTCLKDEGNDLTGWMQHLEGETVTLRYDTKGERRGYFDRLLAYVEYQGMNYNYMLVRTGRARVSDPSQYPFSNPDRYERAETKAKSTNRGLWRCTDAGGIDALGGTGAIDIERIRPASNGESLDQERVVLENSASETSGNVVDLSGWTLSDGDNNSYTFEDGTRLQPTETLVVHTGNGSSVRRPTVGGLRSFRTQYPQHVYWERSTSVWDSDTAENITLTTADGQLASSRLYNDAPVSAATNSSSDVDWTDEDATQGKSPDEFESVTGTFQGSEDGDTVTVTLNGTDRSVDLVGIVWPKSDPYVKGFEDVPDDQYGANCLSNEAEESSEHPIYERMIGQEVRLLFDPIKGKTDNTGYDANDNLHAYVEYNGQDINQKLVASGAARIHYGNFLRDGKYSAAEAAAKQQNRDLWRCQNAGPTGIGRIDVETISLAPDDDSLNEEFIVLENSASPLGSGAVDETNTTRRAGQPVNLTGWTVRDEDGNQYTFDDATLRPGEKIVLYTGSDPGLMSVLTDPDRIQATVTERRTKHRYWGRSTRVWDNDGETVTVTAAAGRLATTRSYGPK